MKKDFLVGLAVLSLCTTTCFADRKWKEYAPLRPQMLSAKAIFLTGGPPAVLDKAYAELTKWGRFQVVTERAQADVVLELVYAVEPSGIGIESLAILDSASGETLYTDGRTPNLAPAAQIRGLATHYGMARDMLHDLRKRIEATESARALEYAIQLAARVATYFADLSTLHERLAVHADSAGADAFRKDAKFFGVRADDLKKTNLETAKYFENATVDDLLRKHNVEQMEMYRDNTLARGCGAIEDMSNFTHLVDGGRANFATEVVQALDAVEAGRLALKADCNSERAIRLVRETAKAKPVGR